MESSSVFRQLLCNRTEFLTVSVFLLHRTPFPVKQKSSAWIVDIQNQPDKQAVTEIVEKLLQVLYPG